MRILHRQRARPHARRAPTSSSPRRAANGRVAPGGDRLRDRASSARDARARLRAVLHLRRRAGLRPRASRSPASWPSGWTGDLTRRQRARRARPSRWSCPREARARRRAASRRRGAAGCRLRRRATTRTTTTRARRTTTTRSRSSQQARRGRAAASTRAAIYQRESPGVVTVISTGSAAPASCRRRPALGLGLRRLTATARSPPTPTSSRAARGPTSARREQVFVQLRRRQPGRRPRSSASTRSPTSRC